MNETGPRAADATPPGDGDARLSPASGEESGPAGSVVRSAAGDLFGRVLGWLRGGYPQGVPGTDYVALFSVLHRHLTAAEVEQVAEELVRGLSGSGEEAERTPIDRREIEAAVARTALEVPGPEDVARVASRLAAGGWPLGDPVEPTSSPGAPVHGE